MRKSLLPIIEKQWKTHRGDIPLNLDNPKTFSERIQWLKLYDTDRGQKDWCDKLKARELVKNLGIEEILVPFAEKGSYPCVLKTNHRSGKVFVCYNDLEYDSSYFKLNKLIGIPYGENKAEWGYVGIIPQIFSEKYLKENSDYRFYCVDGEPVLIHMTDNLLESRRKHATQSVFDLSGKPLDILISTKLKKSRKPMPYDGTEIPHMLPYVKKLAAGWRYVRVDLYYSEGKTYFGELTFWPINGFCNPEYDLQLGELIKWKE
jgi:hypothetical protein